MRDFHEQNRRAWNEATAIHQRHRGDMAPFFRAGGSTLYPFEVDDLGDLRGRRLLHLQCNDGQDSLSLARLGAHVTGVDISDVAIAAAQALSEAAGITAEFFRADVLDLRLGDRPPFDVVYSTRGVLCWISDLQAWMRVAAGCLRPGGFLYLHDDHPMAAALDDSLRVRWSYLHSAEPEVSVGLDYVGESGEGIERNYQWQWSLGDLVTFASEAGLRVRYLREHPHTFFRRWPHMIERDGFYFLPDGLPAVPLSFTMRADRP